MQKDDTADAAATMEPNPNLQAAPVPAPATVPDTPDLSNLEILAETAASVGTRVRQRLRTRNTPPDSTPVATAPATRGRSREIPSTSTKGPKSIAGAPSCSEGIESAPKKKQRHDIDLSHQVTAQLTEEEQELYKQCSEKVIIQGKYIDMPSLRSLHLHKAIPELLHNIGWDFLLNLNLPVFHELICEFYATFHADASFSSLPIHTPGTISFKLLGHSFSLSLLEFNVLFGFCTENESRSPSFRNAHLRIPLNWDPQPVYSEICPRDPKKYTAKHASDKFISSGALLYLHRFSAYTLSGRTTNSAVLTRPELFILWCMKHKQRVNFGAWFINIILHGRARERTLVLGHVITYLAVQQGLLELPCIKLRKVCDMLPLDIAALHSMHLIRREGSLVFFVNTDPQLDTETPHDEGTSSQTTDAINDLQVQLAASMVRISALEAEVIALKAQLQDLAQFVHSNKDDPK